MIEYKPTENNISEEFENFFELKIPDVEGYQRQYIIEKPDTVDRPVEEARTEEESTSVQETVPEETVVTVKNDEPTIKTVIKEETPKIKRGTIQYAQSIDVGTMGDVVEELAKAGISFKVTSGKRTKTYKTKNSRHHTGEAIDIIPINGETFDSMRDKIKNNATLKEFFKKRKLGILEEINENTLKKTGGTGKHFHIGTDTNLAKNFESAYGKLGIKLPKLEHFSNNTPRGLKRKGQVE